MEIIILVVIAMILSALVGLAIIEAERTKKQEAAKLWQKAHEVLAEIRAEAAANERRERVIKEHKLLREGINRMLAERKGISYEEYLKSMKRA